jgi:trehalose synthase
VGLQTVAVRAIPPARLEPLIGPERSTEFARLTELVRGELAGRRVVNVNSTATGGGVAELLQTLLAYARGAGIDAEWLVIEGDPRFFEITKRIHNHLYGTRGDGGPLGDEEHRDYESTLSTSATELADHLRADDIVLLHDPQTAGVAPALRATGAQVVWRCHVGIDVTNEHADTGWRFLRPYLADVDAHVFSCARFAPPWVPRDRLHVIPPSIDPFSAKNEALTHEEVLASLRCARLVRDGDTPGAGFTRRDGSRGEVAHAVDMLGTGPAPGADVPLVVQVSRWDALKDMPGVIAGFAEHVAGSLDAHLVCAGPEAGAVTDDPEAAAVLDACRALWRSLPARSRARIHLVCVPMDDPDEAAAIVNALQRHARVVVQKSLAEGFGLTVAEAMWKARPVVGSAVGGIADQIVQDETGYLLTDPNDLDAYAGALTSLLTDTTRADEMGARGRERARTSFLPDRHLTQWAEALRALNGR